MIIGIQQAQIYATRMKFLKFSDAIVNFVEIGYFCCIVFQVNFNMFVDRNLVLNSYSYISLN